jgi:hypothetical protein
MTGTSEAEQAGARTPFDWIEIVATVLLALATVATAWSGYQATRWNGEQAKEFSRANASRIESIRASDLADTQTEIDVATFIQWVDAYAQNDTFLTDFYFARFRAAAQARRNIQRASNYVLCVVLFATALFFAGISTKVTMRGARLAVLVLGCGVFIGTVIWIATFPVSLSV